MSFSFEGVSALIIDCDGTLLDSMPAWDIAEAELVSRANVPFTMDMLTEIRAAPAEVGCAIFHERYGVCESTEAVAELMDQLLMGCYQNEVEPLPGAREFVQAARDAGVPVAVVSSSPRRYLEAGFGRNDMLELFDALVSTEDVGLSKEDPAIYHKTLEILGAPLEGAWGIDDAIYAIRTMKEAGLKTIASYDSPGTGSLEELHADADIVVHSLEELL